MYTVDDKLCTGCAACVATCPHEAIALVDDCARIDAALCAECGSCVDVCPSGAIHWIVEAVPVAPHPLAPALAETGVVVLDRAQSRPLSPEPAAWRSQFSALLGSGIVWAGRQLALGALSELSKRATPQQQSMAAWSPSAPKAVSARQGGRRHRRGRVSG